MQAFVKAVVLLASFQGALSLPYFPTHLLPPTAGYVTGTGATNVDHYYGDSPNYSREEGLGRSPSPLITSLNKIKENGLEKYKAHLTNETPLSKLKLDKPSENHYSDGANGGMHSNEPEEGSRRPNPLVASINKIKENGLEKYKSRLTN